MQGKRLEPAAIEPYLDESSLTIYERYDSFTPSRLQRALDRAPRRVSYRYDTLRRGRVISEGRNIRERVVSRASGDPSRGLPLRVHGFAPVMP